LGKGAKTKGYMMNTENNSMKEFIYNPEEFEYGYSTEYATVKPPGSPHPVYQFVGGNERTITVTLLLDGREHGKNNIKDWNSFIGSSHPVNRGGSNKFSPPPPFMFAIGWFVKKVVILDTNWRYTMFDKDLNPIRCELTLTMDVL
jgi:hypothetical protein